MTLTFGLIVLAMIYAVGDVSGAHLNSAVTLGFLRRASPPRSVDRALHRVPVRRRWSREFVLTATLSRPFHFGRDDSGWVRSPVHRSGIHPHLPVDVCHSQHFDGAKEKGIAVGAVIALEALFAGPICGASMNPARSLAPALFAGRLDSLWVYLTAPPTGALAGVLACKFIRDIERAARSEDQSSP